MELQACIHGSVHNSYLDKPVSIISCEDAPGDRGRGCNSAVDTVTGLQIQTLALTATTSLIRFLQSAAHTKAELLFCSTTKQYEKILSVLCTYYQTVGIKIKEATCCLNVIQACFLASS